MNFADLANSESAWLAALVPGINTQAPAVSADVQAHASVVADLYAKLDATAADAFLATATGDALVAKAADVGVNKNYGTPSTAIVTLALTGTQPSLWQVDQTFQFGTVGDALTPPIIFSPTAVHVPGAGATSLTLIAQSTTNGSNTNVAANTITVNVSGSPFIVSVTNPGAASGGTDEQSDGELQAAGQQALAPSESLTQMQLAAAGVSNIVAAVAVDPRDGHGTINVYALDTNNTLTGASTVPAVPTTGEALAVAQAAQAVGSPGLTIQVAQMGLTEPAVTVNSITQVAGSGLTSGVVISAIQTYMNRFAPATTFYPSQLMQYLFNTAFPGQLIDIELSSLAAVTVGQYGIIRAGVISVLAGP